MDLHISKREQCDLELILNGGFAPLSGFMGKADYESVLDNMTLADGTVWPMPITLSVNADIAAKLSSGMKANLLDSEGYCLATMVVDDIWQPDKSREAVSIFGSDDQAHPAIHYLHHRVGAFYVSGEVTFVSMPRYYDFNALRCTPAELKALFSQHGWESIVAFQTRNPMHRAHLELTHRAAQQIGGHLLIHPVVGMTKPGDVDYYTRVKCYKKLLKYYPEGSVSLSLLPLAMRMGGPREALWHAIIRKNYGCTHFIVGRDHAGPGNNSQGKPFYDPYAAQELVAQYQDKVGITMVPFQEMVYVAERKTYVPVNETAPNETLQRISGTEFRRCLQTGEDVPSWFSYPEVLAELRKSYPPLQQRGFTIFFTGLSGAGKSTTANALLAKLMELTDRTITLLDGDLVRKNLSSELTFSKAHRDLNIRRIGYVASEITKHRGVAICAPIAPYAAVRREVRAMIEQNGGFIEVYVSTPLPVCESRDAKGLYEKARKGEIKGFTGIDDPYETPTDPEVVINTAELSVEQSLKVILDKLMELGYLNSAFANDQVNLNEAVEV